MKQKVQHIVNPLVSVVMPMFNAGKFVKEAVASIDHQSYTNWELIVVDDASTDESYLIVKRLAQKDPRIKLYRNDKNRGIGHTMNRLLSMTRGEYIARMDADDVAFPDRLKKQVEYLSNNPKVGVVGSFMVEINAKNEMKAARKVPLSHEGISRGMITTQTIQNPTFMLKKSIIPPDQLWFDGKLSPVDDLDFWFRLLPQVTFANIPEYLMAYRRHETNSSLSNIKRTFALTYQIRNKSLQEYGYKTNIQELVIHHAQNAVVSLMPNAILYALFKLWKGDRIKNGHLSMPKLVTAPNRSFGVSLVMPVYKGEGFISENIHRLMNYMKHQKRPFELIVVVDGNGNKTYTIAKMLETVYRELKVFGYSKNQGKGHAVKYGMRQARLEYVGYIDAGSDIDYYSLGSMLREINNHPETDVFSADKRHLLSLCQDIPLFRKFLSAGFMKLVNMLMRTSFTDTQVGLKVFKRAAIISTLEQLPLDIKGFAFDVELLKELTEKGFIIKSCPVVISNEMRKSTVGIGSIISMAFDVTRLAMYYLVRDLQLNLSTRGYKLRASSSVQ